VESVLPAGQAAAAGNSALGEASPAGEPDAVHEPRSGRPGQQPPI